MGAGDLLGRHVETPWTEHYLMAGAPGSITTNSQVILAAARECFCLIEDMIDEPRLQMRFWVDPVGSTCQPWPNPSFRGMGHLVCAGFDSQNSILVDLKVRRAIGRFSPAMGADDGYWRTVIFPALISIAGGTLGLTGLPCGCVSREGRGLLLVGPSGSGKSTLALALARAGFAYHADDKTYLSVNEGELIAWGLATTLSLPRDAEVWFGELGNNLDGTEAIADRARQIDPARAFGVQRLHRCKPRGVVFLHRQEQAGFELSPMACADALRHLEEDLNVEAPEVIEIQHATLARVEDLPCWRLAYGGSPQAMAREFARQDWS